MRLHNGQLDITHNIGNGNNNLALGKITGYSTAMQQDNGLIAAMSATKFGENKILVASSKTMHDSNTNRFYDIYFVSVKKDITEKVSQNRFEAWRYPNTANGTTSGYLKDIKTGMFVENFDGELVVSATMEATNDNPDKAVAYSSKKVNARLDFWALYTDEDGNMQYRKIDDLTKTQDGYDTAPLYGIKNVQNDKWQTTNNLNSTTASPYMLLKVAVGDFNNDGYENEVAMLTSDRKEIYLRFYQVTYDTSTKKFSIKEMPNTARTLYTYHESDYIKKWSYNGSSRVPGGDIVAGDFDGDGKTELAAIYYADAVSGFSATDEEARMHGATPVHPNTDIYKWNNNTGKFDAIEYNNVRYGMTYTVGSIRAGGKSAGLLCPGAVSKP